MEKRKYRLNLTFEAPLRFVYGWCTDFREDDNRITGSSTKKHILSSSRKKVAWVLHNPMEGFEEERVRIVTLFQPDKWHLDGFGEGYDIEGDYELRPAGRSMTELRMVFVVNYKKKEPEPEGKYVSDLAEEWSRYKTALEADYSVRKHQ